VAAKLANMQQGARTDKEHSANLQEVSRAKAAEMLNVSGWWRTVMPFCDYRKTVEHKEPVLHLMQDESNDCHPTNIRSAYRKIQRKSAVKASPAPVQPFSA
jgi:hypothetical protein